MGNFFDIYNTTLEASYYVYLFFVIVPLVYAIYVLTVRTIIEEFLRKSHSKTFLKKNNKGFRNYWLFLSFKKEIPKWLNVLNCACLILWILSHVLQLTSIGLWMANFDLLKYQIFETLVMVFTWFTLVTAVIRTCYVIFKKINRRFG